MSIYKKLIEYLVSNGQTVTITKPNEIETELFSFKFRVNSIKLCYFSGEYVAHRSYKYKDIQELYLYVGSKFKEDAQ